MSDGGLSDRYGNSMRIIFVGETWKGSSARSMREALSALPEVDLDEVGEDHFQPKHRSIWLRGIHRALGRFYRAELAREIREKLVAFKPNVLVVYKGAGVSSDVIAYARDAGVATVNIFPDYSPLVYGDRLRRVLGEYDLVISTKVYHPEHWNTTYGYSNRCVFVPHGYDPSVHYCATAPASSDLHLVMVANARPQYQAIMKAVADAFPGESVRVGVAGPGWDGLRPLFPKHWLFPGPLHGRSYSEWLRRGEIVIAPVNSDVVIAGQRQPGDQDTTRTYELAAAHCFFLHFRTPFAQTLFSDELEVPMWGSHEELVALIEQYLAQPQRRREMADAAHRRAVPAYSIPARAAEVLGHLRSLT